jgi:hypothetical protein
MDLIPHTAELAKNLFLGPHGMRGITEASVVAPDPAGKQRANLIGVAANRDDRIDWAV